MIGFYCTGCPAKFSVMEENAGKRAKCPKCGAKLRVPNSEPPPTLTALPKTPTKPPPILELPPILESPSRGPLGLLVDTAKRSLSDMGRKLVGQSSGKLFHPQSDQRELSNVVSNPYSTDKFPWPPGSRLRLILTPEEFLFVECPLFGSATVPLRLLHSDLLEVGTKMMETSDTLQGLADLKYSEKDYRILKALEKPQMVNALLIIYKDETKYDKQRVFFGLESGSVGMTVDESAYHLKQLINSRIGVSEQFVKQKIQDFEEQEAKGAQHLAKLLQIRDKNDARIAEIDQRIAELNVELKSSLARAETAKSADMPTRVLQPSSSDVLAQIEQLGQLRDKGLLNSQEFEAKKLELLARL